MTTVFTYSPEDVKLTICGYVMTGIVSVTVEWNSDRFKIIQGIRGKNSRVQSLDTSATMTVEFLQTSISNDVLTDLLNADIVNQSARLNVTLTDNSGMTKVSSTEGYVSKLPTLTFSNEFNGRQWTIHMLETSGEVKGNARPSGLTDVLSDFGSTVSDTVDKISGRISDSVSSII